MLTTRKGVLTYAVAVSLAAVLVSQGLRLVPESSPVERGAAVAHSAGCIDCHGQPGTSFPDEARLSCRNAGASIGHPAYDGRCSDVLAYFEVVRLKRSFRERADAPNPNRLLQGERLARQYNCFQCHGELGQGGFRNAGALKGYIPGYFGKDFALLTQDGNPESVRRWISQGIDPALYSKPFDGTIARFFIERQEVSMPIFTSLPDTSIQILTDYVIALNQFGAMDVKAIRAYGELTRQTSPVEAGAKR